MRERIRACACFCLELHAAHVRSLYTHAQRTQQSVSEIPYRERLARKAAIPAFASQTRTHVSAPFYTRFSPPRAKSSDSHHVRPSDASPEPASAFAGGAVRFAAGYLIPLAAATLAAWVTRAPGVTSPRHVPRRTADACTPHASRNSSATGCLGSDALRSDSLLRLRAS